GIRIHYVDDVNEIPDNVSLVVYTPAIPEDHKELNYFKENNFTLVKRSDVLGAITNSSFNICVAGTHGKTTISTMIAHLLRDSGFGTNAFLGGISVNYQTNFWSSSNNVSVAEADEYDRSFLKLNPDIAVISSMDADHLDIYGDAETMENAFIEFGSRVKTGGLLISRLGLSRFKDFKNDHHLCYSLRDSSADFYAENIRVNEGSYSFDLILKNTKMLDLVLNMGGMHNLENAVAAIAVASHLGIEQVKIKEAISSFKGVRRRFEYVLKEKERVMIDDYAHHPEELKALITSAKELFTGKKSIVIFQPHLYTRTRDLAEGFAASLDLADEVILLPIYPARELPIEGVSSKLIAEKMKNKQVQVLSKNELLDWIKNNESELLITSGAGDIDTLVEPIKNIITGKKA
ncbi:MAG: UDP-N-acetylmuramate--L-alanine ligase, partial [Chitinophagaceae bacterium]